VPKQNAEINKRQMYDEIARSEAESSIIKCFKLQENALEQHSNISFRVTE